MGAHIGSDIDIRISTGQRDESQPCSATEYKNHHSNQGIILKSIYSYDKVVSTETGNIQSNMVSFT